MPEKSPYPDVVISKQDIWGFMFERSDRPYPDDKVIYRNPDTDRHYTYAQLRDAASDFGKGLKALWNWQKGDVLAFYTPNSIDTPVVIWGTHWAGGIASPANPAYTAKELAFQLQDSGAKALVTQKAHLDIACDAARQVGLPEDRIILMGEERDPTAKFKHFTSIRNTSGATRFRRTVSAPEDLAFLVYSSGTTGLPKGVMLCHRNITTNIAQVAYPDRNHLSWTGGPNGQGDKTLAFLPFFHIYGLTMLVHYVLWAGYECIVMPRFELEKACSLIQKHKVTMMWVAPPVVLALSKSPLVDEYDLSSLKMVVSAAAPLTHELSDAFYARLKTPIKQGYGLSETSPGTHSVRWDTWDKSVGSVGVLLPNLTAKFMSPEGNEVKRGEVGELWLKGPNIFKGYLNNAKATEASMVGEYYKTGDVGYLDERGNFFITDRVKELIKYKGYQVPPAELEGLMQSHPDVADVAVIGLYSEAEATEVPRAYVVLKSGTGDEEMGKAICDWVASRVATHKRLRGGVRFIEEVPKSAAGKVLRRVLKDKAMDEGKAKL